MYKQILKILKMNKAYTDYAGPYPYTDEEKAKMINELWKEKLKKLKST